MEEKPESNTELRAQDVFTAVNNYFLLFFCASCVLCSIYLQELFAFVGQYRVGISVSSLVAIILPVYALLRRIGPGFAKQLCIALPRPPQLAFVTLATLMSVVVADQIYVIGQQFSPVPEEYIESINELRPSSAWTLVLAIVGLCVMVPIAEEFVFRGMIQQIFMRNMGPAIGFLLSGLIFGAVHLNAHLLVSISFFGVFLGYVFYATGNLTYSIVAHSLFNAVALLQLTIGGAEGGVELPFYLRDVRVFVFCLVLFVFFLFKIKRGGPAAGPPPDSER
jgi:membrane protease YdiL (CAAX protease family)